MLMSKKRKILLWKSEVRLPIFSLTNALRCSYEFRLGILIAAILMQLYATTATSQEETIEGMARVIDADVLVIGQQRVILYGVDAPERSQTCVLEGKSWGCYDASKRMFEFLAGRASVNCRLIGEADPFGRRYGICTSGDEDINAEFVRSGMALAFTEQAADYENVQLEAIIAGVGLWQPGVQFEEPWIWRLRNASGGFR